MLCIQGEGAARGFQAHAFCTAHSKRAAIRAPKPCDPGHAAAPPHSCQLPLRPPLHPQHTGADAHRAAAERDQEAHSGAAAPPSGAAAVDEDEDEDEAFVATDNQAVEHLSRWTKEAAERNPGIAAWASNLFEYNVAHMSPRLTESILAGGTMHLAYRIHPDLAQLYAALEGMIFEAAGPNLAEAPGDPRWRVVDSVNLMRAAGLAGGLEARHDPGKGEEGWPRLVLENRGYQSAVFRRIHLELAWSQNGINVRCCSFCLLIVCVLLILLHVSCIWLCKALLHRRHRA